MKVKLEVDKDTEEVFTLMCNYLEIFFNLSILIIIQTK